MLKQSSALEWALFLHEWLGEEGCDVEWDKLYEQKVSPMIHMGLNLWQACPAGPFVVSHARTNCDPELLPGLFSIGCWHWSKLHSRKEALLTRQNLSGVNIGSCKVTGFQGQVSGRPRTVLWLWPTPDYCLLRLFHKVSLEFLPYDCISSDKAVIPGAVGLLRSVVLLGSIGLRMLLSSHVPAALIQWIMLISRWHFKKLASSRSMKIGSGDSGRGRGGEQRHQVSLGHPSHWNSLWELLFLWLRSCCIWVWDLK